ncbi:glycosyltransferase family 4 protein [Salipiger mucosus]|uniref:Glycosyl transferase, group 1 n=1 Tax=Salipiger mucosus DSM 16094 TaxID=1123237 RepID=S9SFC2_9RHOB|nr:glycosyltransferase family 4 protein [Salipiger mucosus]EPX84979.1 glycosyl transferase, group 1 [Salipiger mucosus DSM 16094]
MAKKRLAVISLNPSPPAPVATRSTLKAIQQAFPDFEIEVIYVTDLMKRARLRMVTAAAVAGVSYMPDLLRRRKVLKYAFFRTPFVYRWIGHLLRREIDPDRYDFTIQIQSLFDASVPGVPNFIYTDHVHLENLNFDGFDESDLYSEGWRACEREIYHNATTVFTWSSNVTRSLVEDYGMDPGRVECIHTGSNSAIPEAQPLTPERYARKEILFVGHDWERKGGPVLLQAFRKLEDRHPDASLTVIGRVPETEDLTGVDYLGRVPLETLPAHYARASVFCMPTRLEPFGNVFVEAMWQQLPVVATRVGALPDIVEDGVNGYLVPPGDADSLAERLSTLFDDPDRCASMGAASRERAETHYDWPIVIGRMRQRIEAELAAGQPAGAQAAQ